VAEIKALLNRVTLDGDAADRYPHVFSGGQRSRSPAPSRPGPISPPYGM